MDERLSELKEKQTAIGDKISLLKQTNKKKDEEAAEIRQLIQECRENLNRIKGLAPGSENIVYPCEAIDLDGQGSSQETSDEPKEQKSSKDDDRGDSKRPCGAGRPDKKRCDEILNRKAEKSPCKSTSPCKQTPECPPKKKKKGKERVSCKVDLNKMKVRIRGPSEDLKKLDATQLICLLEKFQCQELIINTGEDVLQDPGEIRLIYFLHPGNIIMVVGIIMIAFLINTNICHVDRNCSTELLLNILYVSSFALHYGMVLWMMFVRGYALRFGLNHDTFHLVDNIILPKHYSVCVLLSALSLYGFLATHSVTPCSSWSLDVIAQIVITVVTFFIELVTICYVIPALIKLRDATDDYIIDEEEQDPCAIPQSYEKNLLKLNKLGWTLCLINFLTLLLLGANIYYITSKLIAGSAH